MHEAAIVKWPLEVIYPSSGVQNQVTATPSIWQLFSIGDGLPKMQNVRNWKCYTRDRRRDRGEKRMSIHTHDKILNCNKYARSRKFQSLNPRKLQLYARAREYVLPTYVRLIERIKMSPRKFRKVSALAHTYIHARARVIMVRIGRYNGLLITRTTWKLPRHSSHQACSNCIQSLGSFD